MGISEDRLVPAKEPARRPGKYIRIRVQDGEHTSVNVNLPLSLAKVAAKFIPKDASMKLNEHDVDIKALIDALETDAAAEDLVDIIDGETRVKIYID